MKVQKNKMENYEFNQHNLWLYIHGDPTEDMTLSGIEYNFVKGDENDRQAKYRYNQFLIFVPMSWLEDFVKFLPKSTFDDGALQAHLNGSSIVVDIVDLCEWSDIDYKMLLTEKEREKYGFDES